MLETMDAVWWIEKADFYDSEWMSHIKFFDSWDELISMSQQLPDVDEQVCCTLGGGGGGGGDVFVF
jgi:hypothetical protein